MILAYGSYAHAANEASIVVTKNAIEAANGVRIGYMENWTIEGQIHADTPTALTAALNALAAAYSINGNSIALYENDATTLTHHYIQNEITRGGVRIKSFDFPEGGNTEYTTYRSYRITVEAEVASTLNAFKSWQETLTFRGGGPRFVMLQTLRGLPQRQEVAESTPYFATQSGNAVGYAGYPPIPAPLFPSDEHLDRRQITRSSATFKNGSFTDFPISWNYDFESTTQLAGLPTTVPAL